MIRSRRRWVSSSAGVGSGLSEEGFTCYWGGDPVSGDSWVLTQTFKNSSTHHWGYALLIWEQGCWEGWCDWSSTVSLQIDSMIITVLYFLLNSWVCEVSELFQPCQSDSAVFCQEVRPRSKLMRLKEVQFLCSRSPLAQTSSSQGFISNTMEVLRELDISENVFEVFFFKPHIYVNNAVEQFVS